MSNFKFLANHSNKSKQAFIGQIFMGWYPAGSSVHHGRNVLG